jgi:hypothetical protein
MPAGHQASALRAMARGGACTTRTAGVSTIVTGLGLVGLGLWARRDVHHGLARERIVAPTDAAGGRPAADRALAATDTLAGASVEDGHTALWVESTELQTMLIQAYLARRLAELTTGLGAVLVGVGAGLAAVPRR